MNNTVAIVLVSLGALLWLVAVIRDRLRERASGTLPSFLKRFFGLAESENVPTEAVGPEKSGVETTIESLERELGIESDHYLCDRIARINEALVARRDKASPKKKGGAP